MSAGLSRRGWVPAVAEMHVQAIARQAGGRASVFVAPFGSAGAASSLRPESEVLQASSQRLKASVDPQGIFNPGLTPDANQTRA